MSDVELAIVWVAFFVVCVVVVRLIGATRGSIGPAAGGATYDWLNEDKRKALEIIVEEKAAARDPEDKDGNLPDLEEPKEKT